MIKVIAQKIPQTKKTLDPSLVWNIVVEDLAKRIQEDVAELSCSIHPDHLSTIIVTMDKYQNVAFDKKFCCQEFSNTISLNEKE